MRVSVLDCVGLAVPVADAVDELLEVCVAVMVALLLRVAVPVEDTVDVCVAESDACVEAVEET